MFYLSRSAANVSIYVNFRFLSWLKRCQTQSTDLSVSPGRIAAKLSQLISVFHLVGVLPISEYMLITVFYLRRSAANLSIYVDYSILSP